MYYMIMLANTLSKSHQFPDVAYYNSISYLPEYHQQSHTLSKVLLN